MNDPARNDIRGRDWFAIVADLRALLASNAQSSRDECAAPLDRWDASDPRLFRREHASQEEDRSCSERGRRSAGILVGIRGSDRLHEECTRNAIVKFAMAPLGNAMQRQEGYVTTPDGVRLYFVRSGEGARTLVVPNAIYMPEELASLAANHAVIFYDLRNRGRSDCVTDPEKLRRGIHQEVDDLETIRRHFDLPEMSLIAHSYPGVIAALYAMKHPEHVARFVQIGPPAPDMHTPIAAEHRFADATTAEVFSKLQQIRQRATSTDPIELCRESWTILRALYVFEPEHVAKIAHWGFCEHRNERNMLMHWNQNILPSLQALALGDSDYAKASMPALIVHGARDRSAPYGGGREWARQLPNARLLTIENAGHVPHLETPDLVLPALEAFLAGEWPAMASKVA
jgi:pimeloyl-ACP methyl ester carboxylesterase